MLPEPGMIGRGLDREVQTDVDSELGRLGGEGLELVDRAQVRVDRVVAARLVADRPRRTGILWPGHERVVAALAVGVADGVNRGQVEDVEAERGQVRQPLLDS